MFKNIVFWLEYPLLHVAPLIKSLSLDGRYNIIVITELDVPSWRLDMGFHRPSFGQSTVHINPDNNQREKLVSIYSDKDSVHIFHGLRHVKENYKCFKIIQKRTCIKGLYFEPQVISGSLKSSLRALIYKALIYRIKKDVSFVLALGRLGASQYEYLGFEARKVFEFAYHVDVPESKSLTASTNDTHNIFRFLYVGQLIEVKNVSLILDALHLLSKSVNSFTLEIVGDGVELSSLKKKVEDLHLTEKVTFSGVIPNNELVNYYQNCDAFILPSFFEGWGAVSLEAVACGLPVIISNACASESIVKDRLHGAVFESNSVTSLASKLEYMISNSDYYKNTHNKNLRKTYVESELSGAAGSKKLLSILDQLSTTPNNRD